MRLKWLRYHLRRYPSNPRPLPHLLGQRGVQADKPAPTLPVFLTIDCATPPLEDSSVTVNRRTRLRIVQPCLQAKPSELQTQSTVYCQLEQSHAQASWSPKQPSPATDGRGAAGHDALKLDLHAQSMLPENNLKAFIRESWRQSSAAPMQLPDYWTSGKRFRQHGSRCLLASPGPAQWVRCFWLLSFPKLVGGPRNYFPG
ncbi:hypothetical protein CKAH01_15154 [Colletotrichum kahawae]|uniref:Uncharacterized protein n=1 Tax=Colletotrichum kahawae TaxID=34407 RepID=A0AAE0D9D1_COLKA|nr:hypothetical protein CKAH01_15154 [Colletotrichum kahawae]